MVDYPPQKCKKGIFSQVFSSFLQLFSSSFQLVFKFFQHFQVFFQFFSSFLQFISSFPNFTRRGVDPRFSPDPGNGGMKSCIHNFIFQRFSCLAEEENTRDIWCDLHSGDGRLWSASCEEAPGRGK